MAHAVFFTWVNRALDVEGAPVNGAKVSFFQSETTTPVTVYSDVGLTTPARSPSAACPTAGLPLTTPAQPSLCGMAPSRPGGIRHRAGSLSRR